MVGMLGTDKARQLCDLKQTLRKIMTQSSGFPELLSLSLVSLLPGLLANRLPTFLENHLVYCDQLGRKPFYIEPVFISELGGKN